MKTKLAFILSLIVFQSCSLKNKIENSIPPIGGSMTAKIEGKAFKASTVLVVGNVTAGTLLSVGGVSLTTKNGIGVNFDLSKGKVETGKTYTCGNGTLGEITLDTDADGYYSTDENQGATSGSIKVTAYDSKEITGTFSGKLYSTDSKKTVSITDGVFSGKITL